ncbi:hypothetical protein [Methylobacterium sp. CM6247]
MLVLRSLSTVSGAEKAATQPPALTNLSSRPTPDLRQLPPQRFHLGVKLAGIHSQLDAPVLNLRELSAQLGVLGRQGEQKQSVGNG